jgi:Na+/melibiose symporter-like transporter
VLLQFNVLVLLFSIIINEFTKRFANKKKLMRYAAIITHSPLLLIFFFPNNQQAYLENPIYHYIFLSIFLAYYLNRVLALPAINHVLKANYTHKNFGLLYSWASSVNKMVILAVSIGFGYLLDYDHYIFVYVYPVLAIIGVISFFLLSLIDYPVEEKVFKKSIAESIRTSFENMVSILKNNKPYLHFEIGFMFYGFAWMVTAAVVTIYFEEVFDMNHATYGFYKNGYNLLAIILLPLFGKLIGKIDPRIFGVITFGSLMLYILFLGLAEFIPGEFVISGISIFPGLLISYTFYAFFAATMALLWFIGSAYFTKDKNNVANYQSIHLSLTGLRAVFAFQVGIVFYQSIGFFPTFMIGVGFLAMGILLLLYSYKKYKGFSV